MKFKKKYIVFILVLSLLFQSIFFGIPEQASANTTGTVTASSLYVRTGPSTNSSHIIVNGTKTYLKKGAKVPVLGSSSNFYYVSYKFNGKSLKGYVHKSYISLSKNNTTPTKKPTPTPKVQASKTEKSTAKATATPAPSSTKGLSLPGTVTASKLIVRSGAGTKYSRKSDLLKNTAVTITSDSISGTEKWYGITAKVKNKTITGYVSGYYVKLSYSKAINAQISADKVNVSTKAGSATYIKNANKANIALAKGTNITIKSETIVGRTKWFKINFSSDGKSYTGYIPAHRLTLKATNVPTVKPSAPTPTTKPAATPTTKPAATPTVKPAATPTVKPAATPTTNPAPSPTPVPITGSGLPTSGSVVASVLILRSGPGTSNSRIGEFLNKDVVTVTKDTTSNNQKWYSVTAVKNNKSLSGYVSGDYIKLNYSKAISAKIIQNNQNISTKAGAATYVKDDKGAVISLAKGKSIAVKNETNVGGAKWFEINFSVDGASYDGYVPANLTNLQSDDQPAQTPTTKPSVTVSPTVTLKPGTSPTGAPVPTNAPIAIPTEGTVFDVGNLSILNTITTPTAGYICNTDFLFQVFNYNTSTKVLSFLNDSSGKPILLKSAQPVTVTQSIVINYVQYYKINFTHAGVQRTGYVMPSVVFIPSANTQNPTSGAMNDAEFEAALTAEKFPESYKVYLRMLHAQYPNWVFKAYQTGLNWNDVINAEVKPGINLIPNYKGIEWLSMEGSAYDWKTDKFTVYDGSYWVTSSRAGLEYYMDPRNFLTTNGIFQFELLKYQSAYQGVAGVNNILKNTPFTGSYQFKNSYGLDKNYSYAETFMKAALYSGVSPYHLASRSKQEVLSSSTAFSGSATGTYSGHVGYYNFYNIGATNSAGGGAIANGLTYAKNGTSSAINNTLYMIPWNDRFKSIVGGAFWIGSRYISRGQDTVYLQKFNVTPVSRYSHQYMGNVEAPFAEAKKVKTAYDALLNSPIVFSIPVYNNMPEAPVPIPAPMKNPNNWIKSLKVSQSNGTVIGMTPSFSQTAKTYDIVVANNVDKVVIAATAVSTKASVSNTGTKNLAVGANKIVVAITAENGAVANYTINIVRNK